MSGDELGRVEELLQRAADLPPEGRAALLDESCAGDDGVRARVEAHDADASLAVPALPDEAPVLEGPGADVGRYRLLEEIGEGGFGVVYMAEQREPVVRKVALKVVKAGMDTREVDYSRAVMGFTIDTLALTDPVFALQPDLSVREFLDRAAGDALEALGDEPRAEARVRAAIGRAYASLGEFTAGEPHLRRAIEQFAAQEAEGDPTLPVGEQYLTLWAMTEIAFRVERADAWLFAQDALRVAREWVGTADPSLEERLAAFYFGVEQAAHGPDPTLLDGPRDAFPQLVRDVEAALSALDAACGGVSYEIAHGSRTGPDVDATLAGRAILRDLYEKTGRPDEAG